MWYTSPKRKTKPMDEPRYPLLALTRLRMDTDGEGVTTLVAGAGCPLSCRYCINKAVLTRAPEWITPEELYRRTRIDDLYFRATCGGLTFGGGEALLHTAFLSRFRQIYGNDWRLYAETSLAVEPEAVLSAAKSMDGFIVDIKSTEREICRQYTGVDCRDRILSNLELLLEQVGPEAIRVRVPLIPGFNTPSQQQESARHLRSMGVTRLELFSYVIRESETAKP